MLKSRGKVVEALVLYDSILSERPQDVEALVGKGSCLQAQGLLPQAFEAFVAALSLDPGNARALTHCAHALQGAGPAGGGDRGEATHPQQHRAR